jgi:hypothetical protein
MTTAIMDGKTVTSTTAADKAMAITRGGGVSLQLITTTATGTWKIYGSNKPGDDVARSAGSDITASFTQGDGEAVANPAGSATSQIVQAGGCFFAYIWAQLEGASGDGTASVYGNEVNVVPAGAQ